VIVESLIFLDMEHEFINGHVGFSCAELNNAWRAVSSLLRISQGWHEGCAIGETTRRRHT
jgi:hypothetical protein